MIAPMGASQARRTADAAARQARAERIRSDNKASFKSYPSDGR